MTRAPNRPRYRGTETLELALLLPMLLGLGFGTAQVGWYFYVQHTVQGAAREGARAAVVSGAARGDVDQAIAKVMSATGLTAQGGYQVVVDPGVNAPQGTAITVRVSCGWNKVGLVIPGLDVITPNQVRGEAVMRKE